MIEKWRVIEPDRFSYKRQDIPFNFHTLNNIGARLGTGDIYLFLNNDTEVITPDWLERMIGQVQRPEIGVVGCILIFPNETIQHAGIVLGLGVDAWAGHSHKGQPFGHPGYEGRLLGPSNYAAITGACMMIEKELFWEIGGMEEQVTIACGDVDVCLKALDTGRLNVVLPDVVLYHYESTTRGYEDNAEKRERFEREMAFVKRKWPHFFANDPFYNPNLTRKKEDFTLSID